MNASDDDSIKMTLTLEQVEAEAKRIATQNGSIFARTMAEREITEEQLASILGEDSQEIREHVLGEAWNIYQPLAAMCLALRIKIDVQVTFN